MEAVPGSGLPGTTSETSAVKTCTCAKWNKKQQCSSWDSRLLGLYILQKWLRPACHLTMKSRILVDWSETQGTIHAIQIVLGIVFGLFLLCLARHAVDASSDPHRAKHANHGILCQSGRRSSSSDRSATTGSGAVVPDAMGYWMCNWLLEAELCPPLGSGTFGSVVYPTGRCVGRARALLRQWARLDPAT